MSEKNKTIFPNIETRQDHTDLLNLIDQETENPVIKDYEKRLDEALEISWSSNKVLSASDYDDISGIRECFDDQRYLKENPPIVEAINKGIVSSAWEHWIQYGQLQRRFAKFNLPFEVLNDRNLNKDLYIFFNREEVSELSIKAKNYLSSKTTIDFSNFDMDFPTSYIFVSNLREQMIALKMASPKTSIIFLRPDGDTSNVFQTLNFRHVNLNKDDIYKKRGLPRYLTGPKSPIFGESEFIAAIHFGFISGSRRIILVGEDFLQNDETNEGQYLPNMITCIKNHGIEIITTSSGSITYKSGATYNKLEHILEKELFTHPKKSISYLINDGYNLPTSPLLITRANGSRIIDDRDIGYLDTGMAAGTAILGHANKHLNGAVINTIKHGALFSRPTPSGIELGTRLHTAMPWYSHFALCSTGSEATMRLIRIARSFTKRDKIAIFSGSWHGTHDYLLIDDCAKGEMEEVIPFLRSRGTPKDLLNLIILLPYNNEKAFETIRKRKNEIAAVFTEPTQGSNPKEDDINFMRELRAVTEECNILLAFDEIITGGRLSLGGFQKKYEIFADLASYGKIFGGGLPLGFVGGNQEIMETIKDPGVRGDVDKAIKPVILGGTFTGNPLTLASANAILDYLSKYGEDVYTYIDAAGERIRSQINIFCIENQIKARMYGIGSICRLIFTDKIVKSARDRDRLEAPKSVQNKFYKSLLEKKIYVAGNRLIFISTSHSQNEISTLINEINNTLLELKSAKLL
jgi:glutamate-1-semialdehyde 2,1-aminomutase